MLQVDAQNVDFSTTILPIVGTHASMKVIGTEGIDFLSYEDEKSSQKHHGCVYEIFVGNITTASEIAIEFCWSSADTAPQDKIPFQVQTVYTNLAGVQVRRVLTKCKKITTCSEMALDGMNIRVASANVAQQCSRLARFGQYEEALSLAAFCEAAVKGKVSTPEDQALYDLFCEVSNDLRTMIEKQREQEKVDGIDVSSMSDSTTRYECRALRRNDEVATKLYSLETAKEAACVVC